MSSLTDRYVWAVVRAVPQHQRTELDREVRALVADAIEARTAGGETDPDTAERTALAELGDPGALAARYADRPQMLIGPTLYPVWYRLLTTLVPIVPPIVGAVVLGSNLLSGSTVGQAIVAGLGTGVAVAIQIAFWLTLVFAVIERTTGTTGLEPAAWKVDDLPELPDEGRLGVVEFAFSLAFNLLLIAGLLWVQFAPPIVIDGTAYPLFDPELWSFWLPYFIAVTIVEIVLAIAVFRRGRWTWTTAVLNAVVGAAFAIPAVYLLLNDLLFNPQLVAAIDSATGGQRLGFTTAIIGGIVLLIVVWDAIDVFLKAHRASTRPAATATGQ
jgi:hypothetical protein